ncbi:hypothetical protein MJA45_20980 [Paenibacillus aurantius]|uniref:Uncharacterized protein n=1 Tax=Paenibacillus aurantius TaxID=2918900 RepID=A0AA96RDS0_9BACL|nr:hypothetical protein [Paenibacillus aurantius]WNQ10077.1 hypothetical protein MJA45_20980 [Paenibacillus aurantius]
MHNEPSGRDDSKSPWGGNGGHSGPAGDEGRKHSGPGLASLIVGSVMMAGFFTLLVYMGTLISSELPAGSPIDPRQLVMSDRLKATLVFVSIGLMGTVAGFLAGFVLGLIGLLQRDRRKAFAVAGTALNGVIPVFVLLFLLLAQMAAPA